MFMTGVLCTGCGARVYFILLWNGCKDVKPGEDAILVSYCPVFKFISFLFVFTFKPCAFPRAFWRIPSYIELYCKLGHLLLIIHFTCFLLPPLKYLPCSCWCASLFSSVEIHITGEWRPMMLLCPCDETRPFAYIAFVFLWAYYMYTIKLQMYFGEIFGYFIQVSILLHLANDHRRWYITQEVPGDTCYSVL